MIAFVDILMISGCSWVVELLNKMVLLLFIILIYFLFLHFNTQSVFCFYSCFSTFLTVTTTREIKE